MAQSTEDTSTEPQVLDLQQGTKYDIDKPMYALLPAKALDEVAKVYTFGSKKYSSRNWERGLLYSRTFSACMRHMWAFWRRENTDSETGLSHLAHAAFNVLALLEFELTNIKDKYDDRPYKE